MVSSGGYLVYEVPLDVCRQAYQHLQRTRAGGEFDTQTSLARVAGVARTTVCKFFRGGPISLASARLIVTALALDFAEIAVARDVAAA